MPDLVSEPELSPLKASGAVEPVARKRPQPGERPVQILQALAAMLEDFLTQS